MPEIEADLGIEVYASKGRGIGGNIRCFPEDFVVEEILTDGSKALVKNSEDVSNPTERGRYLVCLLVKRKWDTLIAIRKIAVCLSIDPERISIAGIKDTDALTAQHISIGGISPDRIANINIKNMLVKPIRFSNEEISSSCLFGNRFTIIIRSTSHDSATTEKRMNKIERELTDVGGLPNFFGHQRFGTVRPITHQVGRNIVKADFEKAALIFLSKPSPYEHPEIMDARKSLQDTLDFKMALRRFPKHFIYERLMLMHLSNHPRDFIGAFRRLPTKLCKLFVQAYQSLMFNRFLSERIKGNFPLNSAMIGDYVSDLNENELCTTRFVEIDQGNARDINEKIVERKMALAIPLIGLKQSFSSGPQGEIEKRILEEENIRPHDFLVPRMPTATAVGSLRRALVPIMDFQRNQKMTDSNCAVVKLSFVLHKGSYATVLLREFMKPRKLVECGF